MALRVMIARDRAAPPTRAARSFGAFADIEICAMACGGTDTVAQAWLHQPDVAVLEWAVTEAADAAIFAEIARWSHATRCILVAGNRRPDVPWRAITPHVAAVFTPACPTLALVDGMRRVHHGEHVVSALAGQLIARDSASREGLTARQRQILDGVAQGMSNTTIAARLGISPKTVDSHRTALMRKLNVNSAPALVLAAIRRGLIEP